MTDLAAALIAGVPRLQTMSGNMLPETEVLAALSAHLDADLAERAGEVQVALNKLNNWLEYAGEKAAIDNIADLITALLAQNAALRAELAKWMERCGRERAFASSHRIHAEAAEAEVEKLRGALSKLHHAVCDETGFAACVRLESGKAYPWPALDEADAAARAALTTEERK